MAGPRTLPIRVATTLVWLLAIMPSGAPAQAQWQPYSSREGRFAVQMPCVGEWNVTTGDNPSSGPYTNHLMSCRSGDELYMVGWTDYAPSFRPDPAGELKANQDNFVKSAGAVLLTSSPTTHQGMPALDFTANRSGAYLFTCRVVMDGYRPVLVLTGTPIDQNRAGNISRFITSLRID